ncbi:LOW QUALITY PROTEIN: kelch repeat and BTB domain-containing protein 13 [Lates calcarifer]|uniref:LOW QUALITY PROTEIN: kelch repeat and BTB domain-containing protein 13 n=1 Tax=Lates calcarifer TaxID=8187 RepID=A0AAJ7VHM9_LATCA|nr:LOW QUALITY PROTEIN: kelch repeat and BTB domain-containing protein 13 [Lates calcarifer]
MEVLKGLSVNQDIHAENATLDPEDKQHPAGWVRVRVEESWFTVERALLAKYSDYFCALFESGMKESHQDELHLKGGVHARGFLIALSVCRGESPTISDPDVLMDAVECAAFLQVGCLVQHLCDIIDSDNCLLLYYAASSFGVQQLFHSAALFLCDAFDDLKEVAESTLPEDLLQYSQSLSPTTYIAIGTHSPSMDLLHDSFRVVCYLDEKEGEWKHLTNLPTLCSTSMAGVAVLDNRLYIVGGVYGYGKDTVDSSFCYNPDSGVWTALPGPQQPRYDFTLLGHEGRLYAIGGEFQKRIISTAECYNIEKGEWTFIQHAPRPVASAACAVTRRRMFVCFWKPPDTTDIYEYVPVKDEWKLATTMVKPQSYGHCMVAHRDNLYVMRNGPCDDFLRCLMDCYNITTGQWTALSGHYINSKGALFTAMIRGDTVFTVKHMLTLEYTITGDGWKPRRQMKGFPKSGSLWTCLLRLPKTGPVIPQLDSERKEEEMSLPDTSEGFVEAIPQL